MLKLRVQVQLEGSPLDAHSVALSRRSGIGLPNIFYERLYLKVAGI
jgi:hypothetical protein